LAQIDRKTGGAFAEDHWGNVFVIHRGKIGGGKKGVGKSLFEQNYRGVWSLMEDGNSISEVAVIGNLKSGRFAPQAAQFVKKIEMMNYPPLSRCKRKWILLKLVFGRI